MATALSLEARVLRLEDEKQIRELLIEYGRRLDARDFRGYAQLFARDGEWIGGLGGAKGPAAIEAMLEKGLGSVPDGDRNVSALPRPQQLPNRRSRRRADGIFQDPVHHQEPGGYA